MIIKKTILIFLSIIKPVYVIFSEQLMIKSKKNTKMVFFIIIRYYITLFLNYLKYT